MDSPIPSTFDSQQSTVLLSQRVRINIIPFQLAILCFHTLTHSFALREMLTLAFLVTSALFAQNTGGGVSQSCHSLTPDSEGSLVSLYLLLTTHYSLLLVHYSPPPLASTGPCGAKPHA